MTIKSIIIVSLSILLFAATGFRSAHALDKSRAFTWLLFFSGVGSSAAGAIIQGQANETYDRYLHTAVQADMQKHIDDYEQKHQQSIIASRTGLGLVIGAILLSIVDAAHIPAPEVEETPLFFGNKYRRFDYRAVSADTRDGEMLIAIGHRF